MVGRGLARWLDWLPLPWRKWRVVAQVEAGDDVPAKLPSKGAVVVARGERQTWIAFDCPCNKGHRIMVNLDPARRPRWTVTAKAPLTLRPSIDGTTPFGRCHFFIRNGNVTWVRGKDIGVW